MEQQVLTMSLFSQLALRSEEAFKTIKKEQTQSDWKFHDKN